MATERQREIALGLVLVVLAFVLYRAVTSLETTTSPTSGGSASLSNERAGAARSARVTEPPETAPDVHLRVLANARPTPISGERDLFRFRPAPPSLVRNTPGVPAGPSALSPIPLKFIGIVEAPTQSRRITALVDSTGHSFHGREGDVVVGQYRILKIGVESIEITYLDGRGRRTIRLSGS